ncbi:MAG: hypothetical protein U0V56_06695 [Actinomycetota bacterium]
MPDSFGKRQRRESKERKAAARAERKQARRANPEAYRGWEDVEGPVASTPAEDERAAVEADRDDGAASPA